MKPPRSEWTGVGSGAGGRGWPGRARWTCLWAAGLVLAGCQTTDARQVAALKQRDLNTTQYRTGVFLKLADAQLDNGQMAEAEKNIERALRCNAQSPTPYLQRSRLHVEKGQFAEALDDIEQALRLDPNLADAHYEMGILKMRLGRRTEAMEALRRAIQTDSGRPAYYLGLAACLAASDRKDESHETLLAAAQRFPEDSEVQETLGESFLMRGEDRRALDCFRRSVTLDATNLQAKKHLADCLYWLGEHEAAIDELRQLLSDPLVTETAQMRAALGECLLRTDRVSEAAVELERARQLDDRNRRVQLLKGHCHLRLRQWAEAVRAYEQALQADPRKPEAHYCLGYVAYRRGQYADALRHLKAALELEPRNPLIHLLMGQCYERLSDTARAEEHFAKALELEDGYELARRRLAGAIEGGKLR